MKTMYLVLDGLTPEDFILQHVIQTYELDEDQAKAIIQGLKDNGSYQDLYNRAVEVIDGFKKMMEVK